MLLHHPFNNYIHAYHMLEQAYRAGKLRVIGVSNFSVAQLKELSEQCELPPMTMQVEGHPYYPAEAVRAYCEAAGIALQTWFPLGHGSSDLLHERIIGELAEKYGKSSAQIVLRWHVDMGFSPMPGSASQDHIRSNAEIFDFDMIAVPMKS